MKRMIMHVHTSPRSRDATLAPADAVAGAKSAGADILLFTEHDIAWTRDELDRLAEENGSGILLLGSAEVAHRDAHLIVIGCDTALDLALPVNEMVRQVHELGGAVILAHPADLFFQITPEIASGWGVDAAEVVNLKKRSVPPGEWKNWLERGMGLVAGLDAHRKTDMKGGCHTLVPEWVETEKDLARALRERLVRAGQ